jgi:hypothetical protein
MPIDASDRINRFSGYNPDSTSRSRYAPRPNSTVQSKNFLDLPQELEQDDFSSMFNGIGDRRSKIMDENPLPLPPPKILRSVCLILEHICLSVLISVRIPSRFYQLKRHGNIGQQRLLHLWGSVDMLTLSLLHGPLTAGRRKMGCSPPCHQPTTLHIEMRLHFRRPIVLR